MKFAGSADEAAIIGRLINAYSAAQTVVEQLQPVLDALGLFKKNGQLDTEKVLALVALRSTPAESTDLSSKNVAGQQERGKEQQGTSTTT